MVDKDIKKTKELKKDLQVFFQKELDSLPEYFDSIEDKKQKVEFILKFMPYFFPKNNPQYCDWHLNDW